MKDISSKTDGTSSLPAESFNSMVLEMENTVTDAGLTLDNSAETTPDPAPNLISKAIAMAARAADFFSDSGSANTYTLSKVGNWRTETAYRSGASFRFLPANSNSGASTVNIQSIGSKDIRSADNSALIANELQTGVMAEIYYDAGADNFKLMKPRVMTTLGDVIVGGSAGLATRLPTSLLGDISAEAASATVTITLATPGVVTHTSHGRVRGEKVYLTTTGVLPTGLSANTTYYIVPIDANSYSLATSLANAMANTRIATSVSQSGTHTMWFKGLINAPSLRRGHYDGTVLSSGVPGEVYQSNNTSSTLSTGVALAVLNIQLPTAGVWAVFPTVEFEGSATSCTEHRASVNTSNSANFVNSATTCFIAGYDSYNPSTKINLSKAMPTLYVNASAATTLYLWGATVFSGGNMTIKGYVTAVRIA